MIKGITFDFGGTLVLGDLDKRNFTNRLFEYTYSLGFRGGRTQFEKVRKGTLENLMKARNLNREIRFEDLYHGMLMRFGLHPEREILDFIHDLYIRSFNVELVSGVEKLLACLKQRFSLAIISNSMSEVPRRAIKKYNLDVYLDTIVISRDIGIRKPDPEIFKFTLGNLGVKSYEAIHVGDSLSEDVHGAKNAGMKTVWLKRKREVNDVQPDFTIRSLNELTSLF